MNSQLLSPPCQTRAIVFTAKLFWRGLLAAWLLVSSVASSFADSYTISLPPGLSLIANQLDNGGNTLNEVLPNMPLLTTLYLKLDCSAQNFAASATSDGSIWFDNNTGEPSTATLSPGEGAFIDNPEQGITLTFTGTPHVPVLPPPLACGCGQTNLLSRQTNGIGTFENITGLAPSEGAQLQRWIGNNYNVYTFSRGAWTPGVPTVNVGEAVLIVTPTVIITSQPDDIAIPECSDTDVTFTVLATGNGSLAYQWLFNGAPITDATNASFEIVSVNPTNAGAYALRISDSCSTVISAPTMLTVTPTVVITSQPASVTVAECSDVIFTVTASGNGPLRYQWLFKGVPIPDAINPSIEISSVNSTHTGGYTVNISDSCSTVTSALAMLTVNQTLLVITSSPKSRTVPECASTTFSVAASGISELSYQWFHEGMAIPDATALSYTIPAAQPADAGSYRVRVGYSCGNLTSEAAVLTVLADLGPPEITSVSVACGTNIVIARFSEALDPTTAPTIAHFQISPSSGGPSLQITDVSVGSNPSFVSLTMAAALTSGVTYTLTVADVKDRCGKVISPSSGLAFNCQNVLCARTYTLDADFDTGTLLNVNHDSPNNDDLRINQIAAPFPFVNIACSARGTAVRIDVNTGAVLGEYLTAPADMGRDPSRTTVDRFGNVWLGNRAEFSLSGGEAKGSVTRIGLVIGGTRGIKNPDGSFTAYPNGEYLQPPFQYNTCLDRDGDGLIRTSKGLGNILAWSNASGADIDGGVSTAEDECIINYTRVAGTGTRTIAVDANNDVWTGGLGDRDHEKISGVTGLPIPGTKFNLGCGGYGGLIDCRGVLWSAQGGGGLLRFVPNPTPLPAGTGMCLGNDHGNYGLGIDPNTGHIWHSSSVGSLYELDGNGNVVNSYLQPFFARGVCVDGNSHVWMAGGSDVWHLAPNPAVSGTHYAVGIVTGLQGVLGVAVDANGKIWAAEYFGDRASRIDPNAGPGDANGNHVGAIDLSVDLGPGARPYNYSDMTGFVTLGSTAPSGIWTVIHDSAVQDTEWGTVLWNSSVPPGTSVKVEVRATDRVLDLPVLPFVAITNGSSFCAAGVRGQFLEIRATLSRAADCGTTTSPILYDLTVECCSPPLTNQPPIALCRDVTVAAGSNCSADAGVDNGSFDPDGGPVTLTQTPPGPFPLGTTPVMLTVTDSQNASSTCMAVVTVTDTMPPTITCPADLVVCADPGQTSKANVTYASTATDNCPGVNFSCDPPSGTNFAVGTTPVICLAIDAAGNTNKCVFTVTVNANTAATPLSNLTRCRGDSAAYTAVTSGGGALSYGWTLDGSPIGTDGPLLVVATGGLTDGNHTVQYIVTGECGLVTNRATLTVQSCARGGPCSFTQGFYGNPNGKFNGTRSITLISNLLSTAPLVVGKTGVRSLTIPQSAAPLLQARMPAGGTPATLTNGDQNLLTAVLPLNKGKFLNILLGQTITLSLNVRLDLSLPPVQLRATFCTQGVSAGPDASLGTADDVPVIGDVRMFTIPNSVLVALSAPGLGINDVTVHGLLELANRALADLPTGPASLPDVNSAVDAINRGFDACRVLVDCITLAPLAFSSNDGFGNSIIQGGGGGENSGPGFAAAAKAMGDNSSETAQVLRIEGFNCEARKAPGEPDIAGNAGGKPLWWQWQATLSGLVTIQTAGSSFDTLLGVYVGPSRSNLTLVASSDDTPGSIMAEVTFPAIKGTHYLIVVDGFDGACGSIVLQIINGAPRLGQMKALPGGQFTIPIEGESGRVYVIEGSSDLVIWEPVAAVENSAGTLQVVDRQARTSRQRFYRVVVDP